MTTTGEKGTSKFYGTKRWQITRQRILKRDLYACQMPGCGCGLTTGRTHPRAAVVDHQTPHHGDEELFWCPDDGLQSLCLRCHRGGWVWMHLGLDSCTAPVVQVLQN